MVSTALASILRSGRAEFNARFVAARRIHPELEPGAFAEFLGTAVDALAQAVEKVRADRLGEVTMAAYDAGLELVGQKLAGPGARMACIEEAWRRILPKTASLVSSAPGRLIPATCNAVHQLASTPGARSAQWIETMEKLAPQCADADAFLKLGQVAAWRAGLAHLRSGAIAAADTLPEALALAALGATSGNSWAGVRKRLLANPWFDPGGEPNTSSTIRVVAQTGAFKGFGGLFIEPPLVVSSGEHFLARSGNECWLLTADVFGATFHRAPVKEFEAAKGHSRLPSNLQIRGSRVVLDGNPFEFPALGEFTSAAANSTTLAVTSSLTHSIVLVALKEQ
jgi:hypothetical protein